MLQAQLSLVECADVQDETNTTAGLHAAFP